MELRDAVLPGLLVLLLVNQVVARVESLARVPGLVAAVNTTNVLLGTFALVNGLPGFEGARTADGVVALLFLMHTAKNLQVLTDRRSEERERRMLEEERKERERLRAAESRKAGRPPEAEEPP